MDDSPVTETSAATDSMLVEPLLQCEPQLVGNIRSAGIGCITVFLFGFGGFLFLLFGLLYLLD